MLHAIIRHQSIGGTQKMTRPSYVLSVLTQKTKPTASDTFNQYKHYETLGNASIVGLAYKRDGHCCNTRFIKPGVIKFWAINQSIKIGVCMAQLHIRSKHLT